MPKGWVELSLEDITSYIIGGDWGIDALEDGFEKIYVIRGTDYKTWDSIRAKNSAVRYVKTSSVEKRELREGDMVLEVSGGGPDQPVGRVIIIDKRALESTDGKLGFSNFFRLIRVAKPLNPFFIKYYLDYAYSIGEFNEMQSHTTNLRNLRVNEFLSKTLIPIPPLPEQQRIVAKLDELMAKIDRSRARLERIPQILKRFRQSVLSAAVSGKLTEEWRERNINRNFDYLLKELTDAKKVRYDTNSWLTTTVSNAFESFGGGTPSRSDKKYWNGNISWVSSGDVKSDHISKGSETITKLGLENSSAKICPVDSVIVVVRSGILQHTLPVAIVKTPVAINQDIKCFAAKDKGLNKWLFLVLKGRAQEILSFNREGTTVQSVKMDTLKNLEISIPSFEEQIEIFKKVDLLFKVSDKIQAHYYSGKAQLDKLPQSILAKAFRGELVPQDEKDEPASVLLSRIAATAAQSKPNKKSKTYKLKTDLNLAAEP